MRGDYAAEVDKVLALKERMGDAPYFGLVQNSTLVAIVFNEIHSAQHVTTMAALTAVVRVGDREIAIAMVTGPVHMTKRLSSATSAMAKNRSPTVALLVRGNFAVGEDGYNMLLICSGPTILRTDLVMGGTPPGVECPFLNGNFAESLAVACGSHVHPSVSMAGLTVMIVGPPAVIMAAITAESIPATTRALTALGYFFPYIKPWLFSVAAMVEWEEFRLLSNLTTLPDQESLHIPPERDIGVAGFYQLLSLGYSREDKVGSQLHKRLNAMAASTGGEPVSAADAQAIAGSGLMKKENLTGLVSEAVGRVLSIESQSLESQSHTSGPRHRRRTAGI